MVQATKTRAPSNGSRGLRYVSDAEPGIRRRRRRSGGFEYEDREGNPIEDEETLARIRALAIPPAWEDVWICPRPTGHLQATGRDARGRKQYRYHPRWREMRDETKYGRMVEFGETLPRLRRRVEDALGERGLTRDRVVAVVVRLLDTTGIRVGNAEYAKQNQSYGLTTLRDKHVETGNGRFVLSFRAKSGILRQVDVRDPRLARIVRQCRDLPGYELFQYLDEAGERQVVESADVNAFIREATNRDFTAKDFRTWWGTVLAAEALRSVGLASSQTDARRRVNEAIDHVAHVLGNTRAVARKSYVHPAVLHAYEAGEVIDLPGPSRWLSSEERGTLALLRSRLE